VSQPDMADVWASQMSGTSSAPIFGRRSAHMRKVIMKFSVDALLPIE